MKLNILTPTTRRTYHLWTELWLLGCHNMTWMQKVQKYMLKQYYDTPVQTPRHPSYKATTSLYKNLNWMFWSSVIEVFRYALMIYDTPNIVKCFWKNLGIKKIETWTNRYKTENESFYPPSWDISTVHWLE